MVVCPECKQERLEADITTDHIVPKWFIKRLGEFEVDLRKTFTGHNYRDMCKLCNWAKGGRFDYSHPLVKTTMQEFVNQIQKKIDESKPVKLNTKYLLGRMKATAREEGKPKPKKALVIGGLGFIGQNIAKKLVENGYDTMVLDDCSNGKKENLPLGARLEVMDIRHEAKLQAFMKNWKPEFVFHLAALPRVQYSIENPMITHDVNVTGTRNVLEASRLCGTVKKVIYSASSSAYGNQKVMPLHEAMAPNPISPYAAQKYIGEVLCKTYSEVYGLPTVCLRYFNVYGEGQSDEGAYALVIAKFLKQKREGGKLTITGDGKQTRDFTHIFDVVNANLLAAQSDKVGKGEVINIGAGNNVSVNTIASLIGGEVEYIAARLEPKDTKASNKKAEELLQWFPFIPIEQGIAMLLDEEARRKSA